MLIHPWAGLPSRQSLYIGLEEVTGWDLMIVTARRWKDDYGRMVRATPDPELRGRLLALPVGLSGNIPLHFFVGGLKHHIRQFDPDCIYIYHEPYAVGTYQMLRAAKSVTSAPVGIRSAQNITKRYPTPFRQWERSVYRQSDFAVVVTENVAQGHAGQGVPEADQRRSHAGGHRHLLPAAPSGRPSRLLSARDSSAAWSQKRASTPPCRATGLLPGGHRRPDRHR